MVEISSLTSRATMSHSDASSEPGDISQLSTRFVADVESTWGRASRALLATLNTTGIIRERLTKFKLEVTPSVDSGVGAHLDIDVFSRLDHEDEYRFCAHATILSDVVKPQHEERVRYTRVLLEADGRMFIVDHPYEFLVELKGAITKTDSLSLAGELFGERARMLPPVPNK